LNKKEIIMPDTINNREAIDRLRATIERLGPKADAYDNLATILRLLPQPSQGVGEDLVWILEKRIRKLTPPPPAD
jgi:hypothetical protein